MAKITIDDSSFRAGIDTVIKRMTQAKWAGILDMANEILRLSQFEVPHRDGLLATSGHVEPHRPDHAVVGYNKVYAARLHENPQFRFQKGRKGKYLIDPIRNNLEVLEKYFAEKIKEALS